MCINSVVEIRSLGRELCNGPQRARWLWYSSVELPTFQGICSLNEGSAKIAVS